MRKLRFAVWLFAFALAAAPALALDSTIYNGIDLWTTRGDGATFADFATNPIPAGFFCAKSAAFSGRIPMQGVPLATGVPGVLGKTDTIVQRLDDAVFNKKGVAFTRLQVRAMTFMSIAPVKTETRPERPIRTMPDSNGPRPVPLTPLPMPIPR